MKTDTKIVLKNVFGELVLSFAFMEIHLLMQCLSYRWYKIAQLCVRGISQPCVTSGYLYMKLKKNPYPGFTQTSADLEFSLPSYQLKMTAKMKYNLKK